MITSNNERVIQLVKTSGTKNKNEWEGMRANKWE